jgi:hypothetical protein
VRKWGSSYNFICGEGILGKGVYWHRPGVGSRSWSRRQEGLEGAWNLGTSRAGRGRKEELQQAGRLCAG